MLGGFPATVGLDDLEDTLQLYDSRKAVPELALFREVEKQNSVEGHLQSMSLLLKPLRMQS